MVEMLKTRSWCGLILRKNSRRSVGAITIRNLNHHDHPSFVDEAKLVDFV